MCQIELVGGDHTKKVILCVGHGRGVTAQLKMNQFNIEANEGDKTIQTDVN